MAKSACCGSCERGGACEGGGGCAVKASGAPEHPGIARARAVTGAHRARGSGGIADIRTETQAHGYTPTAAELRAMGLSLAEWNALGDTDRVEFARGAGASTDGGNTLYDTPEKRAVAQASASGDEAAFTAALERVPPDQRAALVEAHLRAQGASEDAVNAGLLRLAEQGLRGLSTWLNSDLQRDLEQIRSRSQTEQARIREEQETARAEINAATERYRIDHQQTQQQPQPPAQSGNGLLLVAVGVAVVGAVALLVASSRKAG